MGLGGGGGEEKADGNFLFVMRARSQVWPSFSLLRTELIRRGRELGMVESKTLRGLP